LSILEPEEILVKCAIIEALGNLKDLRAVEVLVNKIKTEEWHIRNCAIKALGKIGNKGN